MYTGHPPVLQSSSPYLVLGDSLSGAPADGYVHRALPRAGSGGAGEGGLGRAAESGGGAGVPLLQGAPLPLTGGYGSHTAMNTTVPWGVDKGENINDRNLARPRTQEARLNSVSIVVTTARVSYVPGQGAAVSSGAVQHTPPGPRPLDQPRHVRVHLAASHSVSL